VHPVGSNCTDFPGNVSEKIVECSEVDVQMKERMTLLVVRQSAVLLYGSDFKSEPS
jgi:hypothetical protein